jgi:hypothetical protein
MTETIVPADGWPTIVVPPLRHIRLIAWAIGPNGAVPITPYGRAEPRGAWMVRDECNNWLASDGTLYSTQHEAAAWLQWRARQGGAA